MKYIIMAGGQYEKWQTPKHLTKIYGEPIIARTIRLLKESGVKDISISTNNDAFETFGLPILKHENDYYAVEYNNMRGYWCNAFYPTKEPACYIFGDVVFSPEAIRTIVEYKTDSIMLFGSKEPFAPDYPKWYIEPFAFKVQDQALLRWACKEVKRLDSIGAFRRKPIAWELWNVICGGDPNTINNSYQAINDYTCDIDNPDEIRIVESKAKEAKPMATKKETKTAKKPAKKPAAKKKPEKPKEATAIYKGHEYTIMEKADGRYMLTDGVIHFWARSELVEEN